MTTSISSAAMLVDINISTWTARKLDRAVSSEVNSSKNSNAQAARVNKNLLAGVHQLDDIAKYANTVRNWMYANSLPWSDSGGRLITTASFFEFKTALADHEREFKKLVDNFVAVYPTLISAQAFQLGDMFDRSEYPSADEIASKFAFRVSFAPIPEQGDFRLDINTQAQEELRAQYASEYDLRLQDAMGEVRSRLMKSLSHLSERFDDAEGDKKTKRFHGTILENFAISLSQIKALNITRDEAIDKMVEDAEVALGDVSVEQIRESDVIRKAVKSRVDNIISIMDF